MKHETVIGIPIDDAILQNYFKMLVNSFFKILPMWEESDPTLPTYMRSLQFELLGCKRLIKAIQNDGLFLTLLSILQRLIDNPWCSTHEVKREVFHSISICTKLQAKYSNQEGDRRERMGNISRSD